MKRLVLILACIAHFLAALAQTDALLPAKEGKKWGYINTRGEWVISPRFDRCLPFESRAYTSVSLDGQTLLINSSGQVLNSLGSNQILSIDGDYLTFEKGGLQGVMHKSGSIVLHPDFQTVEYLGSGYFKIRGLDGYGMADTSGLILIEPAWYQVETMAGDFEIFFKASDSIRHGVYNRTGELIIPIEYSTIEFEADYLLCRDSVDKIYFFDLDGRLIITGNHANIKVIHTDYLVIQRDEGDVLFHIPSQTKVDSSRWKYSRFNETLLLTQSKEGKVGLMKVSDLTMVIPENYDYIRTLRGTPMLLLGDGFKMGLADSMGKVLTGANYTEVGQPGFGGTLTTRNGLYYGLLAPNGIEILPPIYDRMDINDDQTIKAKYQTSIVLYEYNNSYKIIDSLVFKNVSTLNLGGKITMQFTAAQGNAGSALSSRWFRNEDGKYGLRDTLGNVAITPQFDHVIKIFNTPFALGINRAASETMRSSSLHVGINKLLTLVHENESRIYGKPKMSFIDTALIRVDSIEVIRALAHNGYVQLINKLNGKSRHFDSRYMGQFSEGIARIYIGSKLYLEQSSKLKLTGIISGLEYLDEFDFMVLRNSNSRSQIGTTTVSGPGFWVYVDRHGNFIKNYDFFRNEQFSSASDFRNGRAIIRSGGLFGLINKRGNYILRPEYASISFLPNCGDSLIKTVTHFPRHGFISVDGDINIAPTYADVNNFSHGYAWVHSDETTMLINEQGVIITSFRGYMRTTEFNNGVSSIKSGYRYAIIDSTGTLLTPYRFSKAYYASEGYIPIRFKGYVGYLNYDGNVVIQPQFGKGESFVNGLALVQEGKKVDDRFHFIEKYTNPKYGYINYDGEMVIPAKFQRAWSFDKNGFAMVKDNKGYGLINRKGEFILKPKYKKIYLGENFYVGQKAFSVDLYNRNGKKVKSFKGKNSGGFQNGLLVIRSGRHFGAVDSNGKWVLKPKYNKLYPFEQGYTACQKGNTCYILNASGDTTGVVTGRAMEGFENGMLRIKASSSFFYVNHHGENVFKMNFPMSEPFEDGYAIVKQDSAFGVIDSNGYFFIYPEYSRIKRGTDGVFIVSKTANIGVCDLDGKNIVTPKCEDVRYEEEANVFCYIYRNQLGYFDRKGKMIFEVPD